MARSFALTVFAALGLSLFAGAAAMAQTLNPIGIWEPNNKESRYQFSYCGEAGDRLCAQLIWIREDVQDARNMKYLNTYMFRNARMTSQGHWSGTVTLEGFNIGGTVTQTSDDRMQLKACALFVFCEDIALNRVQ